MRSIKWARQMIDGREVCLGDECVDSGYLHCTDAQLQVLLTLGVSYTLMGILYPLRYEQILRKDVLTVPNES